MPTDAGASKEVTARKSRLGGVGQISVDKYPRVVYAVAVDLKKALHLSGLGSSLVAEAVRAACLDKNDLRPSMELARELISQGIQGLVFPSVVGGDDNLVVYRTNCGQKALSLRNERDVLEQVRRIASRHKRAHNILTLNRPVALWCEKWRCARTHTDIGETTHPGPLEDRRTTPGGSLGLSFAPVSY